MSANAVIVLSAVVLFLLLLFLRLLSLRGRPPAQAPAPVYLDLAFGAKTTNVEELRQMLEKAKANYKGKDPEAFGRAVDGFVVSLGAQYGGGQIPVVDAVKCLRKLERAAFANPFLPPQSPHHP